MMSSCKTVYFQTTYIPVSRPAQVVLVIAIPKAFSGNDFNDIVVERRVVALNPKAVIVRVYTLL